MARNRLILSVMDRLGRPTAVVDVGAGNGIVSAYLQEQGIEVVAVEPGIDGADACRRKGLTVFQSGLVELELPTGAVPSVGLFDVIEHLADPERLLVEVARVLIPGGLLYLSVPALPLLWSQQDDFACHHRRYTLRRLDAEFDKLPFRRELASYAFVVGVPFAYLRRALPYRRGVRQSDAELAEQLIKELGSSDRLTAGLLAASARVERWLISRRVRLPIGSSLTAVYRRE